MRARISRFRVWSYGTSRNDVSISRHYGDAYQMIDHVSVGVSDLERAARFYESTLAPLGFSRLVTRPSTAGFGKNHPEFWINLRADMAQVSSGSGVHICLRAKSTGEVDAFHAAALKAGGHSDGAPGLRPHDRVRYYAAFVIDPDGNRIEAVTFPTDDAK